MPCKRNDGGLDRKRLPSVPVDAGTADSRRVWRPALESPSFGCATALGLRPYAVDRKEWAEGRLRFSGCLVANKPPASVYRPRKGCKVVLPL